MKTFSPIVLLLAVLSAITFLFSCEKIPGNTPSVPGNITVHVTGISLNHTSIALNKGEYVSLIAIIMPSNATNKAITWSSDNTSVATVSSSGVVTANAVGSATIIVKTSDGGKIATCKVTVTAAMAEVAVTSVSLNKTSLSMEVGEKETLMATVYPTNATDKVVVWYSSNDYVAYVVQSGLVTAEAAGRTTITVETFDGHKTATCEITVKPSPENSENGHEWVDLGLPSGLKWATCNVGASSAVELGDYFAWGETGTKSDYVWTTYKWSNGSYRLLTKYCTKSDYGVVDNKTVLEPGDDAASVNWGSNWRMPTDAEWSELRNNCKWTPKGVSSVSGYLVTSYINGNSIFLPDAGYRDDTYPYGTTWFGSYWSSSLYTDYPDRARCVYFDLRVDGRLDHRYVGLSVRPVTK